MKTLDQYYEAYSKEVFAYIYSFCKNKELTEDIVQETFYRAYLHMDELKQNRIKPWLFRVAYNTFADYMRKEKRSLPQVPTFFEETLQQPSFEETLIVNEAVTEIFNQIDQFPFQQKQALLLSTIHKLSYSEIANILEVSESCVKSLIFRARGILRKQREENQ